MILANFFESETTLIAPGLNQTTDPKTGQTTQRYSMGPFNAKQTTDAQGKVVSQDAEVDVGTGKFATGQAGGITSKAYTPAPGQEGMSSRDLYSMGNANKAATYDRAAAAVNEAPMSPASPALAAPKAPSAPAAPAIPAAFSATTNGQYNQVRDKSRVNGVWRNNPQAASPMSQDPAQRITGYQAAEKQASEPGTIPGAADFDSWEQNGDTAVPASKSGVRQNLYKMPVGQVPQGANITQKYNTYQQQGAHAFPVEPQGGIDQLSKIPLSQVPKGANIVQAPTPAGNLYKDMTGTLEEENQSVDPDLVDQIYQDNQAVIGNNPNLIKLGQVLRLPDGSDYPVQRGDSLSKIARKIQAPVADVSKQVPTGLGIHNPDRDEMGVANWKDPNPPSNAPVLVGPAAQSAAPQGATPAVVPSSTARSKSTGSSVFDVFPDIGGKIYDLTHPSAIPNSPAVAGHPVGTVVQPDWSQTKYRDLGPLTKNPDGVWRAQNGASAVDPAVIAMAEKLSPVQKAKAAVAQPAKAPPAPVTAPAAKTSPEMVPAADSMDPGEEIVTANKPKPPVVQTKRVVTPTPQQPNVIQRIEKGAVDKAGQAYDWLAGLVRKRESGNNFDQGFHYAPGSGDAGPDNRKTTAWGAYGLTAAAILDARRADATLQKPLKEWTPEDQTRAFNIVNGKNLKRLDQLGVNLSKHPEAPSIAIFLGADGAAKYYNSGKFNQDTLDANGGKDGVKAIITQRTKDALAAIEKQKKQRVKETVNTVNVMLKTAGTADDIRHIRNYIDRQYISHGMVDEVAFAQRSHLVERVIEITNQRRLLAR